MTSVTGTAGGKNEKTVEMVKKHAAMIFVARPHLPSEKGPIRMYSRLTRLRIIRRIAIRYEIKSPPIVMETMALKAALDPMLIRPISAVMVAQKKTERSGRAEEPTYKIKAD